MAFARPFTETAEQERARLASAAAGSKTHALSTLPVTILEWPQDLLIELPWRSTEESEYRVVVVPFQFHAETEPAVGPKREPRPRERHSGSWDCIVVASDHPSYPVSGHRLSIPHLDTPCPVSGRTAKSAAETRSAPPEWMLGLAEELAADGIGYPID